MLGTGGKCSRAICGICHVRDTATIQAKRDAATSTLREKRFRRVSTCRTIKQMYYTRLVSTSHGIDYCWTANWIKHLTI